MAEVPVPVDIPNRALFKAAEVCEIVRVQPYVLRSWESEFPDLGVSKASGGARVYRRVDVERVARIKHLLLVEGLTLAGVRRRLEDEVAGPDGPLDGFDEILGKHARERLIAVERGLRSILDLLSPVERGSGEFELAPPDVEPRTRPVAVERAKRPTARVGAPRERAATRGGGGTRRKRSA